MGSLCPMRAPGLRRDLGAEAPGRALCGARGDKKAWEDLGVTTGKRKRHQVGDRGKLRPSWTLAREKKSLPWPLLPVRGLALCLFPRHISLTHQHTHAQAHLEFDFFLTPNPLLQHNSLGSHLPFSPEDHAEGEPPRAAYSSSLSRSSSGRNIKSTGQARALRKGQFSSKGSCR